MSVKDLNGVFQPEQFADHGSKLFGVSNPSAGNLKNHLPRCALVVLMAAGFASSIASSSVRVGKYDFGYLSSGDARATPVQVFDDGKSTYMQFRAGEPIPAIFRMQGGEAEVEIPKFEGPYIKLDDLGGRYTLALGRSQAQVIYSAGGRDGALSLSSAQSQVTNQFSPVGPMAGKPKLIASIGPTLALVESDVEKDSYAKPTKGDRVEFKTSETEYSERQVFFAKGSSILAKDAARALASISDDAKSATSVTIVGRDDSSMREGLDMARAGAIRDALVRAGVPASKISVKPGVAGTVANKLWPSDIRIERVTPTAIARPDPAPTSEQKKADYVKSNVASLLSIGAITKEQARAILEKQDPAQVVSTQSATKEVPAAGFDFKASDQFISATVKRWATSTGYTVVWDAPKSVDASVTGDGSLSAKDMHDALEKLVSNLQRRGYDISATFYSNRVIRFTGVNK